MSRLFLDTEFTELRRSARLLSLAIVGEKDEWFYAEFTDVDRNELSDWHQEHVVPFLALTASHRSALPPGYAIAGSTAEIVPALRDWLAQFDQIEFWADVPAYDWMLFCELFGGALTLPGNVHYIVRDLATLFVANGLGADEDRFTFAFGAGELPFGLARHQALGDAWSCKTCVELLTPAS